MNETVALIDELIATADRLALEVTELHSSIPLGSREEWEAYGMLVSALACLRSAAYRLLAHQERSVTR